MFDLVTLIIISAGYLLVLFFCAWATEHHVIPRKVVQHPFIYVLSLGIYASSWAYYGSLSVAYDYGYGFLSFYFGLSGAFLLAPVLLKPILDITQKYQLSSLADLFAFRFRSQAAGTLTTILMLFIAMPLLALQIQAVSRSIYFITGSASPEQLAIGFCVLMILFTILFGTRHLSKREQHQGLVFAMAFDSLLKLIIMTILGAVVVIAIFNGFSGLEHWLLTHEKAISGMKAPLEEGPWRTTLLMFFASAIVAPHMFHMTFTENRDASFLRHASWGLPLFLLLLSLSTPLILWAGIKLESDFPPAYFALMLGESLQIPWLTIMAYVGGLSAASGLTIVTSLALASMVLNYVVLPLYRPKPERYPVVNIYRRLAWLKRGLICALLLASYSFYLLLHDAPELYQLGIVAYTGTLQLLPGLLCLLYWKKANRMGFISGLVSGGCIWLTLLLMPLLLDWTQMPWGESWLNRYLYEHWYIVAIVAFVVNGLVFWVTSSFSPLRAEEHWSSVACLVQGIEQKYHPVPQAKTATEFQENLSTPLGALGAHKEVARALDNLAMNFHEKRPNALFQLRNRIEYNLSGLMGPAVAHDIVNTFLPLDHHREYADPDVHLMESRIESYHSRLTGMAAELDNLRLHYRHTLEDLPLALCSMSSEGVIMLWNNAMASMTGLDDKAVVDTCLSDLQPPWGELLNQFITSDLDHLCNQEVVFNGSRRYFSLHKADFKTPVCLSRGSRVILMEDRTENRIFEEHLIHKERLASIGQLAAGVAHEIGNPITAISCLAQELPSISQNSDVQENARLILDQTSRVSAIVQTLVTYAHGGQNVSPNDDQRAVNLYECIEESIALLILGNKQQKIYFDNQCDQRIKVMGSHQKLQQVFINLLKNALDASKKGGVVSVYTRLSSCAVMVSVEDQGRGIPESIQEQLFDPFFTTKEAGKGTGLGLALAWNIVIAHSGTIRVVSPLNQEKQCGTRFEVSLPCCD
ncbi:Sporulation kinase A [invertebrate metagenome]|uniref:Sporulation kinase A n=1 Tax=invertebrate metagenome TaxID=1711999 RepID=A0A2H9TBY0_9ZZZZ